MLPDAPIPPSSGASKSDVKLRFCLHNITRLMDEVK